MPIHVDFKDFKLYKCISKNQTPTPSKNSVEVLQFHSGNDHHGDLTSYNMSLFLLPKYLKNSFKEVI